jgi:ElaB/YqjD/DUF883 family membrane-anchored ribosome-binding protein
MTLDREDDVRHEDEEVEAEVTEIRADIEDTRLEMGDTLNELGDRLEPGHLVDQAKDNIRDATIGRVEETARGMSEMVMETIKRNPIPAAMAGAGLALLWMNRSANASTNGQRQGYRYDPGTGYYEAEGGQSGSQGIGERVGEGASAVKHRAGQVGEDVGEAVGQARENVGQAVGQVGNQLDRFMQASPIAMGAIALGAGAVIGALVPETNAEREVLGDAGRQIGTAVRDTVQEATDRAEEAVEQAERSAKQSAQSGTRV